MTDFKIISFGPGELPAFEMLASQAGEGFKADGRKIWWCFENPWGGRYAVALAGGAVAASAYLGGKPVLDASGTIVKAYEIGETWTDPAFRRRGLFSKLVRHLVSETEADGRKLIYGTPNRQSAPGYERLGFHIDTDPRSWLWLAPNPSFALNARKARGQPVVTGELERRPVPIGIVREISADRYFSQTAASPRMNRSSPEYLRWRFAQSPFGYRYFEGDAHDGTLLATFRLTNLGGFPVLVTSELWLNGQPADPRRRLGFLRKCQRGGWNPARLLGIYMHAPHATALERSLLAARGLIPHRQLPTCATGPLGIGPGRMPVFDRFQLSDCDIG